MNEIVSGEQDHKLTRLVKIIFGAGIPVGSVGSYLLLPLLAVLTQSEELTVLMGCVPVLLGMTCLLALIILRLSAGRSLPIYLYPMGCLGMPFLYLGCFFISAVPVVELFGPTGGWEDPRNFVVVALAWAMTLLALMATVLRVTRSKQS